MAQKKINIQFSKGINTMIVFGIAMAVLLLILRVIHWKFLLIDRSQELYSAGIAIVFTTMGIWLASKLTKRNFVSLQSL